VPDRAHGIDTHLRFEFASGQVCGLHLRNCVACPTDGDGASVVVRIEPLDWGAVLSGNDTLRAVLDAGRAAVIGSIDELHRAIDCFDLLA
jgi:hypothetical protein